MEFSAERPARSAWAKDFISLNIFRYDHPSDLVLAGEFLYSKNFFGT